MTDEQLVEAYIAAQATLRSQAGAQMAALWAAQQGYDRADIPGFLARALPLARATKTASVRITSAFVSQRMKSPPLGVNPADVVIRNGADPAEVYTRPFINVWTDLKKGTPFEDAVAAGQNRAVTLVQTDAQLANFATLPVAAQKDQRILGYRRVPDASACEFCKLVAGQRYTRHDLAPIHPHCGCGVDVITEENRGDFTGKRENDLDLPAGVAIRDHGELGPVLVDPADHFTHLAA